MPGIRVANDFPAVSISELVGQFDLPRAWSDRGSEGFGQYSVFTLWSWPLNFVSGLLAKLGLAFEIQERLLLVIPTLLLGYFGLNKIVSELKLSGVAKIVSHVFYLTNTYIILLVDGGQLTIGMAYAFFPLAYFQFIKSTKGSVREQMLAGVCVAALGFLDIRFVYVLGIVLLVHFLYFRPPVASWIKTSFFASFVFIGLNAYWILPAVLAREPVLAATFERVSQVAFLNFTTWKHALFMVAPHWYKNVFGQLAPISKEFIAIPILALVVPFLIYLADRKNEIGFWLLVALVGVFLAKGGNTPLPEVYPWLFANIPGFSLFRDSTKFYFLVALSYSVLIGVAVEKVPKAKPVVGALVVLYFIFLARPVWLGKMTGTFSRPAYLEQFEKFATLMEEDALFSRILWLPARAPLGYSSPLHPTIEALRIQNLRPFATGTVGNYETFNFLRESSFVGELLDVSGVSYIAYLYPDERKESIDDEDLVYYRTFSDQLSNLAWLKPVISGPPVNVWRASNSQDRMFLADNEYVVVGSDRIYSELVEIPGFKLANNVLIFAEVGQTSVGKLSESKVILYGKSEIDLAAALLGKESYISPAASLPFSPGESGWWKREAADFLWWRDFLQQKYGIDNLDFDYGAGWAIAEGNRQFTFVDPRFLKGKVLLARVMSSSRGGKIVFSQGATKIGEIDTDLANPDFVTQKLTGYGQVEDSIFEYADSNFSWQEVGSLISDKSLSVSTEGDINVLNSLVAVDREEWERAKTKSKSLAPIVWKRLSEQEKVEMFKESAKPKLEYERLSPTHYKVTVTGAVAPTTLVFSESYNQLWSLNGSEPFPAYSLFNGFEVASDGEYDLYFQAQRYVELGFFASAATALLITLTFSYNLFNAKRLEPHKNKNS